MLGILHGTVVVPLVIVLFGITIFVHELGHYITARLCGLVVEVFSIGFGPALWKTRHKGIVYKIGWIPFGGYVALPQLDPAGMRTIQSSEGNAAQAGGKEPLPPAAPWKKIIVSASGAGGNVLLAVAIAWLVYWIGMPGGPSERSAVVGFASPASKAYVLGLRTGDAVLEANGKAVTKWSEFQMEAALSREVRILFARPDGTRAQILVPTERGLLGEQSVVGVEGRSLCMVLQVETGKSADKAGMLKNDLITAFNGVEVLSRAHLIHLVDARRDLATPVVVERFVEGAVTAVTLTVTPEFDEEFRRARIGIHFNTKAVEPGVVMHPGPADQLREHASAIFRFLGALVTPKTAGPASKALGGPVAIVLSYWVIVRTSLMLAMSFTAFLNVNLAIINLLPIPVLDGGHIMFSLWELVTRRPVGAKAVNILVNVFAVLLIAVFLLLSVRDMDRFTSLGDRLRRLLGLGKDTNAVPAVVTNALPAEAALLTNAPPAAP